MPSFRLPAPGTSLGPCEPSCDHTDCAETRRQAESLCPYCGQPIGYETRFYYLREPAGTLAHAACHDNLNRRFYNRPPQFENPTTK